MGRSRIVARAPWARAAESVVRRRDRAEARCHGLRPRWCAATMPRPIRSGSQEKGARTRRTRPARKTRRPLRLRESSILAGASHDAPRQAYAALARWALGFVWLVAEGYGC